MTVVESFTMKKFMFLCVSVTVVVVSALFLYLPVQNVLCDYGIFERFLVSIPLTCSLFDTDRLSRYNGAGGGKIYLSILGTVFDVTDGRRFYGPGGTYHGFAGRDASRSYITGLFDNENLTDNVIDLKPADFIGLDTWLSTYRKKYKEIGKLIGRYYDSSGKETDYCKSVYNQIELSKATKEAEKQEFNRYPGCNVQYVQENQRSKIWCTTSSGGVRRNWIGVPRKLQTLNENGKLSVRCVCVQPDKLSRTELARIAEYDNCDASSTTCLIVIN